MTPTLTPIDQQAFVDDVLALAAKLAADTDWRPHVIVGIGRGGICCGHL